MNTFLKFSDIKLVLKSEAKIVISIIGLNTPIHFFSQNQNHYVIKFEAIEFGSVLIKFLTRPRKPLGRGLVMGSKQEQEEEQEQEEDIFEFQFLVNKCLAWGAPNQASGPKPSTWAPNRALGPELSTWALNRALGPELSTWT